MSNTKDDSFSEDDRVEQGEKEEAANGSSREESDDNDDHEEDDDDEDSEEQEEEDDDDDDEGSEEEEEDEDNEKYRNDWKILDTFCSRLRGNDIAAFSGQYSWEGVPIQDDDFALKLAGSLKKNESLTKLRLSISEDVTQLGARALSRAMERSAVVSLTIDDRNEEVHMEDEEPPTGLIKYIYPMSTMKNLKTLAINYDLGNAEMEWIGMAVRSNKSLEDLTVRLGYHRVRDAGARTFSKGISSSTVKTLELQNATPEVCDILLATGIMSAPQLRHFAIINDWDIDRMDESPSQGSDLLVGGLGAAVHLKQVSQLESLHLQWCYLNIQNLQVIACTMQGNSSLKELRLTSNGLEDDSVPHLVHILEGASQVESLAVYGLWITGSGLETLLAALSAHPALKSLKLFIHNDSGSLGSSEQVLAYDGQHFPLELRNSCSQALVRQFNRGLRLEECEISFSRISVAGIHQILKASATWSFVTKLHIQGPTYNVGHKGFALIAQALSTAKLSSFSMSVFDKDLREDAETKRNAWKAAFQGVVLAVKSNPYIQELNVNGNRDEIRFFLNLNKHGRQLLRLDHDVPLGLWSHVLAKHGKEAGAVFFFLREQPNLILPPPIKDPRNKRPWKPVTTTDETKKRRQR